MDTSTDLAVRLSIKVERQWLGRSLGVLCGHIAIVGAGHGSKPLLGHGTANEFRASTRWGCGSSVQWFRLL